MTKKKKSYSKQFKVDAVKLITEQDYKASEGTSIGDILKAPMKTGME